MKPFWNLSITLSLMALSVLGVHPVYSCGVDWTIPKDHFDGVNERGYVSIWDQIGILDLGDDLKIPLIIGFESNREWSSPHLGQGFILALLDSRFEQVDEGTFHMIQPDGWTTVFRREPKNSNILGGQGGWKAEITENTITAYASCGWKLIYKQGKISSIGTNKGRTLDFHYAGGRVTEIRENGNVVLSTKVDPMSGEVIGLNMAGKEISLSQGQRPQVQRINNQNLVSGMVQSLSEIKGVEGKTRSYNFTVDEKINPKMTIDKGREIVWDAATKRILKDGQWTYQIVPNQNPELYAAIGRVNELKQKEFWHLDAAKGQETVQTLDGIETVRTWFVSGPLLGLKRSITEKAPGNNNLQNFSYDDKGRILRQETKDTLLNYRTHPASNGAWILDATDKNKAKKFSYIYDPEAKVLTLTE